MGSGTVIRWHAFPLLQLLKKVLPKGFRELLLGEQYFVKPLATGASDPELLWKSGKMVDTGPYLPYTVPTKVDLFKPYRLYLIALLSSSKASNLHHKSCL